MKRQEIISEVDAQKDFSCGWNVLFYILHGEYTSVPLFAMAHDYFVS